ncbi:MAG: TIGR01212 family radical SAM protein [Clostridia bacterium]|nr:TIGR01212 family radical SAM protein [Clostridia bacterium]
MKNQGLYNSLNDYYRSLFGKKMVKLSLDAGFSCPNRTGKISTKGCIFCSAKGSGDFAGERQLSITQQIEQQKNLISKKWQNCGFIAYFQAFTNTYAPIEVLRKKYTEALSCKGIEGISIATRPDCIDEKVIKLLSDFSQKSYVCVELGLQTSNEKTADFINRGYKNEVFEKAVKLLNEAGLDTVCHIIFGLPGENMDDMVNSVKYAVSCEIKGIKIQLLHVLKDTPLEEIYNSTHFHILEKDEYIDIVLTALSYVPENIVIHRLTGDGPKDLLISPKWSLNKRDVLNSIHKRMSETSFRQGSLCKK